MPFEGSVTAMDTLNIKEVKVVKTRLKFYSEDVKVVALDSGMLQRNPFLDLGELLSLYKAISITSYGSKGALSSVSLRGTGSSHTSISWHGIPLNSITSGTADLSLIPSGQFTNVSVAYGSPGSLYGSGAFGGALLLGNEADWSKQLMIQGTLETGAFNSNAAGVSFLIGNQRIQFRISPFFQSAKNDFRFRDIAKPGNPVESRVHDFYQKYGFVQNLYLRLPGGQGFELGTWYQVKLKEIPLPMGSFSESRQNQTDSTLKAYIKYSNRFRKSSIEVRAAYSYDYLRFLDKQPDAGKSFAIDSRIITNQVYLDLNSRFYHLGQLILDAGGNVSFLSGSTGNYANRQENEYRANLVTGAKLIIGNSVINGSLRYHTNQTKSPKMLYSLGFRLPVLKDRMLFRGNYSTRYRLPGFNDKYWIPGGNPDLLPEYGWGADIETKLNLLMPNDQSQLLVFDITVQTTTITNWIQWVPVSGYWRPVNYKQVWSRGLESGILWRTQMQGINLGFMADYSLAFATVVQADNPNLYGKQLRYLPKHLLKIHLKMDFRRLYTGLEYQFTGKRYTTEDNDLFYALDPVHTINLDFGYQPDRTLKRWTLRFKIVNIFNKEYQMIRSYPMPGRSWQIGLNYTFQKNQ